MNSPTLSLAQRTILARTAAYEIVSTLEARRGRPVLTRSVIGSMRLIQFTRDEAVEAIAYLLASDRLVGEMHAHVGLKKADELA